MILYGPSVTISPDYLNAVALWNKANLPVTGAITDQLKTSKPIKKHTSVDQFPKYFSEPLDNNPVNRAFKKLAKVRTPATKDPSMRLAKINTKPSHIAKASSKIEKAVSKVTRRKSDLDKVIDKATDKAKKSALLLDGVGQDKPLPKTRAFYRRAVPVTGTTHHPFVGIDFEDDSKGNFKCCGMVGEIGQPKRVNERSEELKTERVSAYFTDKEECQKALLSLDPDKCIGAFYNLFYDKAYMQEIIDPTQTIKNNNGDVIEIVLTSGLKCWDMHNLSAGPIQLKDWITSLHLQDKGIYKAELADQKARVMNDAAATFYVASFLEDEFVYKLKVPMYSTSSQVGKHDFAQNHFEHFWFRKAEDEFICDFARNGFYGPRIENWNRTPDIHTYRYDMNGAYNWVMATQDYPDPSSAVYMEHGDSYEKYFNTTALGFYHVDVEAPEMKLMVLPVKDEKGHVSYPSGTFTGTWTNIELKLALKYGYKILKCHDFVWYRHKVKYFREIALKYWAMKEAYQADSNYAMAGTIKKIINGLFGKFGQRNNAPDTILDYDDGREWEDGKVTIHGDMKIQVQGERIPAQWEFPEIPAFTTSYLRCELFKHLKENEDNLISCCCDSIHTSEPAIGLTVSKNLGEWKLESERNMTHSTAFIQLYKDEIDGKQRGVIRGVSKRADYHGIEKEGKHAGKLKVSWVKPMKEREAESRGVLVNTWLTVVKYIRLWDITKRWESDSVCWPPRVVSASP